LKTYVLEENVPIMHRTLRLWIWHISFINKCPNLCIYHYFIENSIPSQTRKLVLEGYFISYWYKYPLSQYFNRLAHLDWRLFFVVWRCQHSRLERFDSWLGPKHKFVYFLHMHIVRMKMHLLSLKTSYKHSNFRLKYYPKPLNV